MLLGTVDSAACFCLISDALAKKLGTDWDPDYACDAELANGKLEKTSGMCSQLPLRVEGVALPGNFHVVKRPDDYLLFA